MITDRIMGNQANEHSEAILRRKFSVELLKCCRISTTRTTVLSRERSLRIQYSCREKMDVIISNGPSRATLQSLQIGLLTMIIRQSSIQSLNTRRDSS